MAARAFWTGTLRISLVNVPVRLQPALTAEKKIAFHKIFKPTGERVHYQNVTESRGPVDKGQIVKGFEYQKGSYVTLEDDELEKVRLESRRTIDVVQFVRKGEIDPLFFDKPYFLIPDGEAAEEPYAVIRDAMRQEGVLAVGQVVFRQKEHIAAVRACGRGMVLETLRYAYELRSSKAYFEEIEAKPAARDGIELAQHLIKTKIKPFDPERFHDHYQEALRELVAAKLRNMPLPEFEPEKPAGNVIDLMAALRASLGGKPKPAKAPARKKAARKGAARKKAAKPKRKAA